MDRRLDPTETTFTATRYPELEVERGTGPAPTTSPVLLAA